MTTSSVATTGQLHRLSESGGKISIERKLELLENRFTSPSPATGGRIEGATPEANSPSSESHHSYAFDPPAGSRSSAMDSNTSATSNLPPSSVRSKRKSASRKSSLEEVALAAERQMRKVQAARDTASAPLGSLMLHDQDHSLSALASPPMSLGSASNQTLLTSHLKRNPSEHEPQVVAESPPMLTAPPAQEVDPGKPKAARAVFCSGDKRKSVPVKRDHASVTDMQPTSGKNVTPSTSRKRSKLRLSSQSQASPTAKQAAVSEPGKERSNPGKSKGKAPTNNTLIRDFFPKTAKRTQGKEQSDSVTVPSTNDNGAVDSSKPSTLTPRCGGVLSFTSASGTESRDVDLLQQRCQQLEQMCNDKDEQLKAVSNNQTILHTSLRASLAKKEKELEEAIKARESLSTATSLVIEKLVRSDSAREAHELRQKLASDGARLGRIVYSRAGMRVVENWEDGQASKLLKKRRAELRAKRASLERRRESTCQAAEQLANKENDSSENCSVPDALSVIEAEESVRFHLDTLQQQERELEKEERSLNEQKVEHIRAWRLVESEDASRFRSRPKLNDRYIPLSLLGKGGFSEVWRAYDLSQLREVAVKIHQLDPRWAEAKKENYIKHVTREYEIHRYARHPRIVSLYGVFEIDENSFATVIELCKGTNLDRLLKAKGRLPERDARAILIQMLSGMHYLCNPSENRQGIIHYDLKPGNILFDEHGDAKITDFGLSKIVDAPDPAESMELTSQGAGTYWYLPPECFVTNQSVRISNKVDVWSIGIIYYEMLYGKRPFGDGLSQQKYMADHTLLNVRELRFPESPQVSDEGKEFIQQCLTYDQAFRPTISRLCEKEYILKKRF